jgi:hypothetical protein
MADNREESPAVMGIARGFRFWKALAGVARSSIQRLARLLSFDVVANVS